jgi:hypothetical protein
MLERAGLSAGRVAMVRRGGWLRHSARLATRRFPHHQSRLSRSLRGKTLSQLASWYGYWTRQADCLMVTATAASR